LIDLPRTVGDHPDDGQPITANIGRYGPYVHHDKTYANIPNVEDVFEIGVNRAVAVIADKRANGGRRGGTATALKELGEHDGKPVRIMSGRYGPYVKYEKVNATLPKDTDPESVTLEQAMEWVEAKAAKGGKKKAPAKKKPAAKKTTAAKKTAAKKTTAKKPAAKKPAAKKTATKKPAASASGSE
ncbi:topoisomerase C-terminal repeat-containing protein, partial [uncultured Maricaulis sp.]|uniref:topoisomerase C-terminal repeat-containing protein n=1 Tax=uncultured Maricaulis sp. TaxID=174710 RepID=UPI0030DC059C